MVSQSQILVVDDDSRNLQVIGSILKNLPYKLYIARNGKDAVQKANEMEFDVILLDIQMPEMNGFEACPLIKKSEFNAYTPIIFLSVLSEVDDILMGFKLGAVDYLTKPFNHAELRARLSTHIRLRKAEAERTLLKTDKLKRKLISESIMLNEKQELLNTVQNQLLSLLKDENLNLGKDITRSIKRIGSNIRYKHDWNEFDKWFTEIHSKFYPLLLNDFPQLSQKEIKVCALLRLNIQSKDIATIFNVQPTTIEVYRYRIRKKFGLNIEDNLHRFISTY